jgi:hypothetical protein
MNINTNFSAGMARWTPNQETPITRPATSADSVNFQAADKLNGAIKTEDDIRPLEVAKALSRIGEGQWPPHEVMVRIANMLALNMQSQISK